MLREAPSRFGTRALRLRSARRAAARRRAGLTSCTPRVAVTTIAHNNLVQPIRRARFPTQISPASAPERMNFRQLLQNGQRLTLNKFSPYTSAAPSLGWPVYPPGRSRLCEKPKTRRSAMCKLYHVHKPSIPSLQELGAGSSHTQVPQLP